jgi:hypothetical protein
MVMDLAQGSETFFKILVLGVGHLRGKREIIWLVGPYERAYERVVSLLSTQREELSGIGPK